MKFFVPTASEAHADKVWHQVRLFADPDFEGVYTPRRVHRVVFERDGAAVTAEVGALLETASQENELVFVILESETAYHVCTVRHGVTHGRPYIISASVVRSVTYFD